MWPKTMLQINRGIQTTPSSFIISEVQPVEVAAKKERVNGPNKYLYSLKQMRVVLSVQPRGGTKGNTKSKGFLLPK